MLDGIPTIESPLIAPPFVSPRTERGNLVLGAFADGRPDAALHRSMHLVSEAVSVVPPLLSGFFVFPALLPLLLGQPLEKVAVGLGRGISPFQDVSVGAAIRVATGDTEGVGVIERELCCWHGGKWGRWWRL